jgi:hypothetical protein
MLTDLIVDLNEACDILGLHMQLYYSGIKVASFDFDNALYFSVKQHRYSNKEFLST